MAATAQIPPYNPRIQTKQYRSQGGKGYFAGNGECFADFSIPDIWTPCISRTNGAASKKPAVVAQISTITFMKFGAHLCGPLNSCKSGGLATWTIQQHRESGAIFTDILSPPSLVPTQTSLPVRTQVPALTLAPALAPISLLVSTLSQS